MPRGRPLTVVDANASCAARLGAELRALRVARNLTLDGLSRLIGYSTTQISEVERARSSASEAFVAACDHALDAGGRLLALLPATRIEQQVEREKRELSRRMALRFPEKVDDVRRRAFIGLGLSVVLLGPEAAARASRDDWERIAHAWSYEIWTAPDMQALLPGLAADLKRLHANGGPQRVVAQLANHVAAIAVAGDDPGTARRWWRRSRAAALAARDRHLIAYVTGRQAIQGLYGVYSPRHVVGLADDALRVTTAPCAGRIGALAARSQALAMLGREKAAGESLALVERTFEKLPRDVTREKLSALGWPEERLHHVRSYCGMYGTAQAAVAREEALRLYADADWRGRAQVSLHRAASEADAQDAVATLSGLSEAQRNDRFVRRIAAQALVSCDARGADVRDLRDVLAA